MFNLLKAETYRLLKGKTFYITLACIIGYLLLIVLTKSVGVVGINTAAISEMLDTMVWSGFEVSKYLIRSMNLLQYFFLPIIVVVMGTDFTYATCKNTIGKGISRTYYYLTKLLIVFIICIFYSFVYIGVGTLIATILYGFHGTITAQYLKELVQPYVLQMLIMFVLVSIAAAILFISKKPTACSIGYLIVPLIIQIVIAIISANNMELGSTLLKYEVLSAMNYIAYGIMEYSLSHYLFISLAYIAITSFLGMYLFNKIDLT